jgi:hypothetical protein
MLAVGGLRAPHRVRQVGYGAERGHAGVDAPGHPGRDFLDPPIVAVGIIEREPRALVRRSGSALVELLRAVDIRDGDNDDLELLFHDAGSSPIDAACADAPAPAGSLKA